MIFLTATTENATYMNLIFSMLEGTVGLRINQTKSQLFFSKGAENKSAISTILHIPEKSLLVKYLGIPLTTYYIHVVHCTPCFKRSVLD